MYALPRNKQMPQDYRPPIAPDVHISYGQSWRANDFPSFGSFGLNPQPQTLLACKVSTIGNGGPPGPLANSAGIGITGTIIGVTGYQASDRVAIGRCAIAGTQLWRLYHGAVYLKPILEFCAAYPSSTWQAGPGGGLGPGPSFTASISAGSMNVTAVASRTLAQGQRMVGPGIPPNTFIIDGANPGTTGIYRIAATAHTLPGTPMQTASGAQFVGGLGATVPNDTMTVTAMTSGTITIGDTIVVGLPANTPTTTIIAQLSGTTGGVGTYQILVGAAITQPSGPYQSQSVSWTNQLTILNAIQAMLPITMQAEIDGQFAARGVAEPVVQSIEIDADWLAQFDPELRQIAQVKAQYVEPNHDLAMAYRDVVGEIAPRIGYLDANYRSVGYTQGGSSGGSGQASKIADLTDMLSIYDGMALPGTSTIPLNYYLGLPANTTDSTVASAVYYGTVAFCRTHAPGQGGAWSGRCFFSSCSYPWLFNGADNIHTGDYGTTRWGEWEGYVKHLVEDLGIMWTPLWRPLTGGAITRSGQTLTVPLARPAGPDFATAPLVWQSNRDDGVKVWSQSGFHVRRRGVDLTVAPMISGMTVLLAIAETINPGDSLEVSYAWYGPGGPNPGTDPGTGGNLCMNGAPSVFYPNGWNGALKTLDAWCVPFIETIVA